MEDQRLEDLGVADDDVSTDVPEADPTAPTMELAVAYGGMADRVMSLEAELEEAKKIKAGMEKVLIDRFANESLQSVRIAGGRLLYLHRQIWAGKAKDSRGTPVPDDVLFERLREAGPDWGVIVQERLNTQSLSAFVRRLPQDELGNPVLPPDVAEVVGYTVKHSINTRRS